MSDELPDGWEQKKLGEIAFVTKLAGFEFTKYVKYSNVGEIPVIRAQNVTKSGFQDGNFHYVSRELLESLPRSRVLGGEILMVFVGSVGNVGLVPKGKDYFLGPNVAKIKIENEQVSNKFILYYLMSDEGKTTINSFSKATTQGSISMGSIREIFVPIPRLSEQKRIADKLDSLLVRVDTCQTHLERMPQLLKQFRQSVLAAAMTGRLLENETEIDDEGLPIGWEWVTIENACERIVDCLHSTPKFTSSGHYCIDSTWIKPGIFIFEKARFVDDETFVERNRRMKPQQGDVVFSREGALLGVAVCVPNDFEFCLGQRMMIFRAKAELNSKFLEFFLNSQTFRSQYAPLISGTASPHLNIGDIRICKIPLPPLPEQHEIVRRVERLFAFADRLEARYRAARGQVAALTTSLLAKAFRGELVKQEEV